jgi:hypothetical protein
MGDSDNKMRSKHQRSGTGWTVGDRIKVMSMIGTVLVAVLSAIGSFVANKNSSQAVQTVEITRVETGDVITNSNYRDYTNPWVPWKYPMTTKTLYVGLQRNVVFARPFANIPHVSTALCVIDTKPPGEILTKLGYPQPDKTIADRLRDIHIVTSADGISENGFTLEVGIGLPIGPGEFLAKILSEGHDGESDDSPLISDMLHNKQLSDRPGLTVSQNELWLLNFYKSVGAIRVSWIAQSREK